MKTPDEIMQFCATVVQDQMRGALSFPMSILLFTDAAMHPLSLNGMENDNNAKRFWGEFVRWSVPYKNIQVVVHVTEAWVLDPAKTRHYTPDEVKAAREMATLEHHPDVIEVAMIQVETASHIGMHALRLQRAADTSVVEGFEPVADLCHLTDKQDMALLEGRLTAFFNAPDPQFIAQPGIDSFLKDIWLKIPTVPLADLDLSLH